MNRPTLLCVDDDPSLRDFYEALLVTQGYRVLTASGAPEALKLFRANKKAISAVISDYQMAGMNGAELATELKRRDPKLPVILVSGWEHTLQSVRAPVDAVVGKGAPIGDILHRIEVAVGHQVTSRRPPLSGTVPWGPR